MFVQLLVIAGPDQGRFFNLTEGQTLVIGRGQNTEIRLRDPHVSRNHCQVQVDAGKVLLRDASSAAGTEVNGEKVTVRELRPGDVIRLGDTQLRFQLEASADESTQLPAPRAAKAPKAKPLAELVGTTVSHFEVGPVLANRPARGSSTMFWL